MDGYPRKKVFITVGRDLVERDVCQDSKGRPMQRVTLPDGVEIDGKDASGYSFLTLFADEARFAGPDWVDLPLLADRDVRLSRIKSDESGKWIRNEEGRYERDQLETTPDELKAALAAAGAMPAPQNR